MPNKQLIKKKISLIDQYLKELLPITKLTLPKFLADYKIYRTTERNLQLIVDTALRDYQKYNRYILKYLYQLGF